MPRYPDDPELILADGAGFNLPKLGRKHFILIGMFLLFLAIHNAVPLYTDWLWFKEVGFRSIFTTTIIAKLEMFSIFGLGFFVIFYGSLLFAKRHAPNDPDKFMMEKFGPEWGKIITRALGWALLLLSIFVSLWAGRFSVDSWTKLLEFTNWTPFNITDPVFGNDVGFYVFRLPLLRLIANFLTGTLAITLFTVVLLNIATQAIQTWAGLPNIKRTVRAQLMVLFASLAAVQAFSTRLDSYDLLFADNGVFSGAGYVDDHYRKFAFTVQIILLIFTSLACLISAFYKVNNDSRKVNRPYILPFIGVALWAAANVLLGIAVPTFSQKFSVEPNQLGMEQEYIKRNIAFTRKGFGLEKVQSLADFPADESLDAKGLHDNIDTLENVRLWDYQYLGQVYNQVQTVQNYYKFKQDSADGSVADNIDIDRYTVGGKLRQVMLAAREMDSHSLPAEAQAWQIQRLSYTHGYGLVMSPVNRIVQGGPDYFIQGFPPVASPEASNLLVNQPDIYYGQLEHDYVFVDTAQPEFDYPTSESGGTAAHAATQGHYTTYTGSGGIRIGDSLMAKLAFSLRLSDPNILLAKGFTEKTRVLFRRDIRDRVQTAAPFVQQDGDPYLVLQDNGKLIWMIDCYTMSDKYPYSTPRVISVNPVMEIAPNYIRNSIKATVDAYDGKISFYLTDPADPIAKTYSKIFPGLLKPLAQMPNDLKAHMRYPEDLFRLQRSVYATYHVDDPRTFFLKSDAWTIPSEPNVDTGAAAGAQKQFEPYYVIMRLPDTGDKSTAHKPAEEFVLMTPLAPVNGENKNILGWMSARCDGEHYGELILYRFPQKVSVNGPSQMMSLINTDPTISKELSLLRTGGSDAKFGNMLVIPVEQSLLYIAPLYIYSTSSGSSLPQLQKVVVGIGARNVRVAMDDSLEKALTRLFEGYSNNNSKEAGTSGPSAAAPTTNSDLPSKLPPALREMIKKAGKAYDSAQSKLKSGDFAGYGEAIKGLESSLKALQAQAGVRVK